MAINWMDKGYSCYTASIGKGMKVGIYWEKDVFNVRVFGLVLKKTFRDLETAQCYAESVAVKWLKEALQNLTK